MNKSQLFKVYNHARGAMKAHPEITAKRLNKALGHLQSGEAARDWERYRTTVQHCECPDHYNRGSQFICHHRLSKMISIRAGLN